MLKDIPFSLLESVAVREQDGIKVALQNSLCYAQAAESLGFKRFWLAEHHNTEGIASSAPAVLIGYIASRTSTLRVGSGGVMLPNHPPLVIAEQFGTLACLYPDRIDLGLGRSSGTDSLTSRALRRDNLAAEQFPTDISSLQQLLAPVAEGQNLKAIPGAGTQVPIWLLGSSLSSAQLAATRGLPYVFAGHFAPRLMREAVHLYQTQFQPSATLSSPYMILTLPVLVADTEAEARWLSTTGQQRILALKRGQPVWIKPPVAMEGLWDAEEELHVREFLSLSVIGTVAQVKAKLESLVDELGINEFMFTIDVYDPEKRRHALKLLAETKAD